MISKDLVTGYNSGFESEICNIVKCSVKTIISNVLLELIKN